MKDTMFHFVFRLLWRLLILIIGAVGLWLAIFKLYPAADSRMPAFFALLLLYCGVAYFFIPFLFRLLHIFIKPNHIPLYAATGDGWPSDPVNLAIIARNKAELRRAMKKAGWHEAHPLNFKNGLRALGAMIMDKRYLEAPMSNLYLFNRPHDIGFEIPTGNGSPRTRHHVRFWKLKEPPLTDKHAHHYAFWKEQLQHFLGMERDIWIGAATEDIRMIDLQWRTGQITHGVSHDADKERDFLIGTLKDTGSVQKVHKTEPGEVLRFRGQHIRTFYITDGGIKVVRLK
jgi:hypothetical protein